MSNISNIAKISVEKHDSKEQFLYDLDKSKTLCDIVSDICKSCGLPISTVYGLKRININNPSIDTYLSDKNYHDVQHNDCLKIVFSISYLLNHRILPHINEPACSLERVLSYEALLKLALDPIFIEELVETEKHSKLLEIFINDNTLREKELLALLATICHLFQLGFISDMPIELLQKTIDILKSKCENFVVDHIQYALSILQKILVIKNQEFIHWKEKIIETVPITCLTPYIRHANGKKLQYGVLLLINTIIKCCKGEQKKQLIKEMNLTQNREDIYKHIIAPGGFDKKMEHELYVIQTYILSLYEEALNSNVSLNDNNVFKREEFELPEDDVRRLTILLDFDEATNSMRSNSLENLLSYQQAERLSLASVMSDKSVNSRKSSTVCSPKSRQTSFNYDFDNLTISYLTLEALRHYKNNHKKNFCQSQIEERVYEPGIFVTSEKVVKILADVLDIGKERPNSKSVFYQPIVFNTSPKMPFFLELFSRSMWLLSRTRREMKVSTIEDYPKLMRTLKKQIKMVLKNRPLDFKTLTDHMSEMNFDAVLKHWQDEKEEEMKELLKSHPCIQELKEVYTRQNEPFLRQNRMNVLKKGEKFPKVFEKKAYGKKFVQLSRNERELYIYNIENEKTDKKVLVDTIIIADITHVAIGRNCKHANICKNPVLLFSIIISNSEKQENFIAESEKIAATWTDAFNIMTGNPRRSNYYNEELDTLVEMDLKLQLIELQNITIPKDPPEIPPIPKPVIPPKPESVPKKGRNSKPRLQKSIN